MKFDDMKKYTFEAMKKKLSDDARFTHDALPENKDD